MLGTARSCCVLRTNLGREAGPREKGVLGAGRGGLGRERQRGPPPTAGHALLTRGVVCQTSQYGGWDDFHSDMLLVRDNCKKYNPPGHVVTRDCEEVFAFYLHEYEKTLERWSKVSQGRAG